jgi:hypothetical protein
MSLHGKKILGTEDCKRQQQIKPSNTRDGKPKNLGRLSLDGFLEIFLRHKCEYRVYI